MIGNYLIFACVWALVLSFLGIIHRFWLGPSKEKSASVHTRRRAPVVNPETKRPNQAAALSRMQMSVRSP